MAEISFYPCSKSFSSLVSLKPVSPPHLPFLPVVSDRWSLLGHRSEKGGGSSWLVLPWSAWPGQTHNMSYIDFFHPFLHDCRCWHTACCSFNKTPLMWICLSVCLPAVFLAWCHGFMYKAQLSENIHEAPTRTQMPLSTALFDTTKKGSAIKSRFF